MKRIALLSCASRKKDSPAAARDLYVSDLFRKSLRYAESLDPDMLLILSAKHGVVQPDEVVAPYDETLNRMSAVQRRRWANILLEQLEAVCNLDRDAFVILAGIRYREHLVPHLAHFRIPLKGLRIGEQLRFLNRAIGK